MIATGGGTRDMSRFGMPTAERNCFDSELKRLSQKMNDPGNIYSIVEDAKRADSDRKN